MIREIIKIDEELCDGCGICVPACAEGALQIIDGKARLISDLFCDGLGACISECPQGAITIERREAEPYNEYIVMETIVKGGPNVINAHLKHLRDHREFDLFAEAIDYLNDNGIKIPALDEGLIEESLKKGCPGNKEVLLEPSDIEEEGTRASQLSNWPVQMHLISPTASHFRNSDLLFAADCAAFSYGDFHKDYIKNKSLAIACPKLDSNKQVYLDKLITLINQTRINSITVIVMEVPCCSGLVNLVTQALDHSERKLPVKVIVFGIKGDQLKSIDL